jgi:hypothetical protein
MGSHKAEESLQLHYGPLCLCGEDAGQDTGGREDPAIYTPPIIADVLLGDVAGGEESDVGHWGSNEP